MFYTLITAFFIIAPVVCINYEIVFQSGLVHFTVGLTFIMLITTMIGDECSITRGKFYILHRVSLSIIVCAALSIAFLSWYLWNTIDILSHCSKVTQEGDALSSHKLTVDQQFNVDRAAKVCRNEHGFAILLLCLLIGTIVLNILTIIVYTWLRSWTRRLCPDMTPICG